YLLCSGLFSGLREDPDFRLGPGESDEGPAVVELQSPTVDGAHLRAGIPEGEIEVSLDCGSLRRSIGDRPADHRISRDLSDQLIEGPARPCVRAVRGESLRWVAVAGRGRGRPSALFTPEHRIVADEAGTAWGSCPPHLRSERPRGSPRPHHV